MADLKSICIDGDCSTVPSYLAGSGIGITNGVISNTAPGVTYTAGTGINIDANNVISATGGGGSYTAGTNIDITNNVISATNLTKIHGASTESSVGSNSSGQVVQVITESPAGKYSLYATEDGIALWDYNDSRTEWSLKPYTAGSNIQINNGVISATDTTYPVANTSRDGLVSADVMWQIWSMGQNAIVNADSRSLSTSDNVVNWSSAVDNDWYKFNQGSGGFQIKYKGTYTIVIYAYATGISSLQLLQTYFERYNGGSSYGDKTYISSIGGAHMSSNGGIAGIMQRTFWNGYENNWYHIVVPLTGGSGTLQNFRIQVICNKASRT